jgi:DNA helicase HerA-like ATPase/predicted transcriptional regulator
LTLQLGLDDAIAHTWIVGSNTAGKSNTLLYRLRMMAEDYQGQRPCALVFIDPHGDAAMRLARSLGSWERLTILDPTYVSFGLNPLELPEGLGGGEERAAAIQTQIGQLESILWELFRDNLETAPRMLTIFRTALYYLYETRDKPTFRDLFALFLNMLQMDGKELAAMLRLGDVRDGMIASTMEAISALDKDAFSPGINRISSFVMPSDSITSRTFGSSASRLDFGRMLEPGMVTIFRLPKFQLPPDFTKLVTASVVIRLFLIVQKRARDLERAGEAPEARTPVILAVDEFQNVAGLSVVETILTEARKFGLYLWMAHQNLGQLDEQVLNAVMGNAGTIFSFRVGPDDAQKLAKVMYPQDERRLADHLSSLPNHRVVVRRNPVAGSGLFRTFDIRYPRLPEPVHPEREVMELMRGRMERLYGRTRPGEPAKASGEAQERTTAPPSSPLVDRKVIERILRYLVERGFTTRDEVARSCETNTRSVSRALAHLAANGLIERRDKGEIVVTEAGRRMVHGST